jgi:hypothetical protein
MTSDTLLDFRNYLTDTLPCTSDQMHGNVFGVTGTPHPLTLANDDWVSLIMIVCFVLMAVLTARSGHFVVNKFNCFFLRVHKDELYDETPGQLFSQFIFVLIDCVMLGMGSYLFAISFLTIDFFIESAFLVSMFFVLFFLVYFFVKWSFQSYVNVVFFGGKKNGQWLKTQLYITAWSTVLTFILVMIQTYLSPDIENMVFSFVAIVFLNKTLTFIKQWQIFFKQKGFFLQIILYFCALEITPLVAASGFWFLIVDNLKINF